MRYYLDPWIYLIYEIPLLCSAFVGLAMTVLLTPIPGLLAKSMQSLQQTKMKKTDARIQTVTESMLCFEAPTPV